MNDQFRLPFQPLVIWLMLALALLFVFSCKKEEPSNSDHPEQAVLDSIAHWAANGRNVNASIEHRQEQLRKAWEAAQRIQDDSARLKSYSRIQWSYLSSGDSLGFRKTNHGTRRLAQQMNDTLRVGFTYWDLGIFLSRKGVKDSAFYHLSQARKLFEALGDQGRVGRLIYSIANIQSGIKDYTGGEINAIKAIELLKPLEENFYLYRCYNLLGILAKDLKEYEKSLEYYDIADTYLEKAGAKKQSKATLDNNIGVTYREMGEHKKAIDYFTKVLGMDSLLLKDPDAYAITLTNLATSSQKIGSDNDIESLFLEALRIRDSIGDKAGMAGGSVELAQYYLARNDSAKALAAAQRAKVYAKESTNNERWLESLDLLAQLDPTNASRYSREYIRLSDSLQSEERKIRNKFARIQFETDEVEAENQLLARQKQLWTGIAVILLLLGVSIFIMITQRARNQKLSFEKEQQASNEKIFNLMLSEKQKFEEGKKLEQKRISEELHDGVLGKMLGARMVLTGLNKKADEEAINNRAEAIAALKDVEGEVRSLSHELSHAAYQQIDNFIRSIQDLLKNIADASKINHTFNYTKEVFWDDLQGDIKINVYRMVQESLQNTVKHARCQNVEVDFSVVDDQIQILIKDDGIGFDINKRKKGIGMRNIGSRIKKVDGTWQIESSPGEGTTVKLSIPIVYFSTDPQVLDEAAPMEKV